MGLNEVPGISARLRRASFTKPDAANALACASLMEWGGMHIVPNVCPRRRRDSDVLANGVGILCLFV